jgi:hypothetical protein
MTLARSSRGSMRLLSELRAHSKIQIASAQIHH